MQRNLSAACYSLPSENCNPQTDASWKARARKIRNGVTRAGCAALPFLSVWVAVLALGSLLLPERLDRVRFNYDIGHADGVAYAWQARTLIRGDGLNVPYITNFFYLYPDPEARHDDQWSPLLSFALVPVFNTYGAEPNVARMTTVVINTLLLPLCVCILVQSITRRAWPGLIAPLPVFFSQNLANDGLDLMNDQLISALVCLFLAAILLSRRHMAFLLACGPLAALAWYGKGSQIILFPFLIGATALLHGPKRLLNGWLGGSLLLGILLMSPRLTYNLRAHGNPLHSTQSHVSAFFGLSRNRWTHWDRGFYAIHFNHTPPGLRNRFAHPFMHARSMRRNSEVFLRGHLLGLDAETDDWAALGPRAEALFTALRNSAHVRPLSEATRDLPRRLAPAREWERPWHTRIQLYALVWGAIALPLSLTFWIVRLFRAKKSAKTFAWSHFADPATLVLLLAIGQAAFVILFWDAMPRLTFPALILGLVLPWTLLPPVLDLVQFLWRKASPHRFPFWTSALLTPLWCSAMYLHLHPHAQKNAVAFRDSFDRPPPTEPAYPRVKRLGEIMAETLPPDAVLMSRRGWQTLWYAPETFRSVGLPYARPTEILAVAKHYGVTHLVLDQNRPGLRPFINEHSQIFTRVIRRPVPVYQIHYDRIPEDMLPALDSIEPLWDAREDLQEEEDALRESSDTSPER